MPLTPEDSSRAFTNLLPLPHHAATDFCCSFFIFCFGPWYITSKRILLAFMRPTEFHKGEQRKPRWRDQQRKRTEQHRRRQINLFGKIFDLCDIIAIRSYTMLQDDKNIGELDAVSDELKGPLTVPIPVGISMICRALRSKTELKLLQKSAGTIADLTIGRCRRRSNGQRTGRSSSEKRRADTGPSSANQCDDMSKDFDDLIEELLKLIEETIEDLDFPPTKPASATGGPTTVASRFRDGSPNCPNGEMGHSLVRPNIHSRTPEQEDRSSSQSDKFTDVDSESRPPLLQRVASLMAISVREGALQSLYKVLA